VVAKVKTALSDFHEVAEAITAKLAISGIRFPLSPSCQTSLQKWAQ
jgi:hypothetical protein